MEQLPLELLLDLLKLLPKKDKKALRLVSKSFSALASPQVFDSVYLSFRHVDILKAASAFKYYASSINAIVLHPLVYPPIRRLEYRDVAKSELDLTGRLPYGWHFEEHVTMGFNSLSDLRRPAVVDETTRMFKLLLRALLQRAGNPKRLVLTDRKRYADFKLAKFCRWKDCPIPKDMHQIFEVTPSQYVSNNYSVNPGENIPTWMSDAILDSGSHLRELVVEQGRTVESLTRTTMQTFLNFIERLHEEADLMSNLTKLKLTVDDREVAIDHSRPMYRISYRPVVKSRHYKRSDPVKLSTRKVAKHLAVAKNLEKLSLTVVNCDIEKYVDRSPSMFYYILHGCRFPKLQTFVLDGCSMEGDEIMEFLDGSPDLQHLVLASCSLQKWRWTFLAARIKAKTHLTALSIEHVLGRSWPRENYNRRFVSDDDGFERFLLHGGPNPLVCRSWVEYGKKWRPPFDAAITGAKRKVDWYHENYF